jgi:hypothetical protein
MAKEQKTARELEDIIAARTGVSGLRIAVFKDRNGWAASITVAPVVKDIVAQIQEIYDIKE